MARPRTYSDTALATAVAEAGSWRGVLRALGMKATSSSAMRSVRRQADLLGLDYSHFTGQRRWNDAELREAVQAEGSWHEVAERLGLDPTSASNLRAHAARLGIDARHLEVAHQRPSSDLSLAPSTSHLRRAGPMLAAAWFTLCGCDVSWPLEPCRYDLLVGLPGQFSRVQVKTATRRTGQSWTAWLSTTSGGRRTYDLEEIDHFFVIDGSLNYYLIPVGAVGGLHAIQVSAYGGYRVHGPSGV